MDDLIGTELNEQPVQVSFKKFAGRRPEILSSQINCKFALEKATSG